MHVYFISGLGADKTVFQLIDLQYCEPVFIDWITPFKQETLPQYALRLKKDKGIEDDAVIVGLSFGGMLATEIAKAFPKAQVIYCQAQKLKMKYLHYTASATISPLTNGCPTAYRNILCATMKKCLA